jgi:hypothetical protein
MNPFFALTQEAVVADLAYRNAARELRRDRPARRTARGHRRARGRSRSA